MCSLDKQKAKSVILLPERKKGQWRKTYFRYIDELLSNPDFFKENIESGKVTIIK